MELLEKAKFVQWGSDVRRVYFVSVVRTVEGKDDLRLKGYGVFCMGNTSTPSTKQDISVEELSWIKHGE